jgi:hypothetical protein
MEAVYTLGPLAVAVDAGVCVCGGGGGGGGGAAPLAQLLRQGLAVTHSGPGH